MKITVDLDPQIVWQIQAEAARRDVTPGVVLRERLAGRRNTVEFENRVRSRVLSGMCDADIAQDLGALVRTIADTRRRIKLPANPRRQWGAA